MNARQFLLSIIKSASVANKQLCAVFNTASGATTTLDRFRGTSLPTALQVTTYTMETWATINSASGGAFLFHIFNGFTSGNGTSGPKLVAYSDGSLLGGHGGASGTNDNSYQSAASQVPRDVPVHLAVTFDSATKAMKLYVNGAQIGVTTTLSESPAYGSGATKALNVGCNDFTGSSGTINAGLLGVLSDIRLHNVVRSSAYLLGHYTAGFGSFPADGDANEVWRGKCNDGAGHPGMADTSFAATGFNLSWISGSVLRQNPYGNI
jgi:hypothetical protein